MVVLGSIPLSHLTEVRACLLGFAVKLAARHGTPADFAAIAANIDETETLLKKPDPIASVPAISEFYILLGCASHNHIMEMLVDSLTEIVRDLLLTIRLKATLDIISPRRRTLACIIAGDGEGAEREIQAHLVELTKFIADRTALDG
jgi:DNA-binding FadR family transcriptional regulator